MNPKTVARKVVAQEVGCSFYRLRGLEKSDRVSKTKRERDSTEQVTARNWAKERTTVPLREAELGGE